MTSAGRRKHLSTFSLKGGVHSTVAVSTSKRVQALYLAAEAEIDGAVLLLGTASK